MDRVLILSPSEAAHLEWLLNRQARWQGINDMAKFAERLPASSWSTIWGKLVESQPAPTSRDYKSTPPPS